MISVVICSINNTLATQVHQNIDATIGVAWQPIFIDNTKHPQGITKVYNDGAAKAIYKIVCFVHEDVLFETLNWGLKVVASFKADEKLGLIGIAGSKYKSNIPSGWYSKNEQTDCCNILHKDKTGQSHRICYNPQPGATTQEVVVLDGVLLCCPTKVWSEIRFDEKLLQGFHLYDIDYSFRVAQHYKVIVSYEIDLVHLTEGGSFGNEWVKYTLLWHQKNKAHLPASTIEMNKSNDLLITKIWLLRLKKEKISIHNKLKWLQRSCIISKPKLWPYACWFLLRGFL